MGVELVSHVNAVTLRSEEITQALSCVCTGQTIQISQATRILRHKNATIPLSSRLAFDTLNSAEIQSERLQEILKRISLKLPLTFGSSHQHDT